MMYNAPYAPYTAPVQPNLNLYGQNAGMPQIAPQSVIRVNGENGARAYQMPPNSSALLLDETAPIVWLVQTDGAGYKTLSPYDIAPHQDVMAAQQAETKSLEARVKRLEGIINGQSDTGRTGRQEPAAES